MYRHHHNEKGSLIILTLVFGTLFVTLTSSLVGFVLVQKKLQFSKENREKAIHIAEAGLEYYKWRLAHYPQDLQDGTNAPGPYVHEYTDPETGTVGEFSLEVEGNSYCGQLSAVEIRSTGYTAAEPTLTREIYAKYARPSVAEYAYILNSNVWAGNDREIFGRYHSNGGIRMDGTNYSSVTSALTNWFCTSSFGCSSAGETKPGIFGVGSGNELWKYPTPSIDFAGITLNLTVMKNAARNNGGIYLNPRGAGYHLVLKNNGSVDIYDVQSTSYVWAYSNELGWHRNYEIINRQRFIENRIIPAQCPIIFVEDNVWIDGVVSGKVTVVSANENSPAISTRAILSGNITYVNNSGVDGFTLVAEEDVLIPLQSPNIMTLSGIYIAQTGHFGRNHYTTTGTNEVPTSLDSYVKQDLLTVQGTIVSNGREGTQWLCTGVYCSGYAERENNYDRKLSTSPPPLTPYTSDDFMFVEWREMN